MGEGCGNCPQPVSYDCYVQCGHVLSYFTNDRGIKKKKLISAVRCQDNAYLWDGKGPRGFWELAMFFVYLLVPQVYLTLWKWLTLSVRICAPLCITLQFKFTKKQQLQKTKMTVGSTNVQQLGCGRLSLEPSLGAVSDVPVGLCSPGI